METTKDILARYQKERGRRGAQEVQAGLTSRPSVEGDCVLSGTLAQDLGGDSYFSPTARTRGQVYSGHFIGIIPNQEGVRVIMDYTARSSILGFVQPGESDLEALTRVTRIKDWELR